VRTARVGDLLVALPKIGSVKAGAVARRVLSEPLAGILRAHRTRMFAQRNAARAITKAAKSAGLVGVGFHTLRHGFASTLILGSPIRCACSGNSGTLGPSLTLDVYAHIFERAGDLRERIGASSLAAAVARS
jgi:integrase